MEGIKVHTGPKDHDKSHKPNDFVYRMYQVITFWGIDTTNISVKRNETRNEECKRITYWLMRNAH